MKYYIRVDVDTVNEVILPFINETGEEIPIDQRFTTEFLMGLIEVEGPQLPEQGWHWDGSTVNPPQHSVVELTKEQVSLLRKAAYTSESDCLKLEADFEAIIKKTTPNYSLWVEKIFEIKSRYPF